MRFIFISIFVNKKNDFNLKINITINIENEHFKNVQIRIIRKMQRT
jgi:hypothetical protein